MKRIHNNLLIAAAVAAGALTVTSCSEKTDFTGEWVKGTPANVTDAFQPSKLATSTTKIMFERNPSSTDGNVTLTADYDITPAASDTTAQTAVKGTATVFGTWSFDVDDENDLLLSYDMSTVSVSMADSTASAYKDQVSQAFMRELTQYSVLEDVEVSKDGKTMTVELQSPERKVVFRKTN